METLIEVKQRTEWDIKIFDFTWELDETNADTTFSSLYEEIWDFSGKKILFNLENLKYLNSKSIGYIADVFSNLEDNDGMMHISNCDEWVQDVLELVGITTIIPTVPTEKEALEAMSS